MFQEVLNKTGHPIPRKVLLLNKSEAVSIKSNFKLIDDAITNINGMKVTVEKGSTLIEEYLMVIKRNVLNIVNNFRLHW
jgi:hypothetical protein